MPGIPGAAMTATGALLLVETTRDRCVGRAGKGRNRSRPVPLMASAKSEGWEVRGRTPVHGVTTGTSAIKRETTMPQRLGGSTGRQDILKYRNCHRQATTTRLSRWNATSTSCQANVPSCWRGALIEIEAIHFPERQHPGTPSTRLSSRTNLAVQAWITLPEPPRGSVFPSHGSAPCDCRAPQEL